MTSKIKIVNLLTGEETIRDYTPEELLEQEQEQIKVNERATQAEAKATAKEALLARLGITAEEAQLLLGGN
jgi:hypothetical protein